MNGDIGCLAFGSSKRLMDHDFAVGESKTFALCASHQNNCSAACSHAKAHSRDIRLDDLHRVVHCERTCHLSSGGVDVERDVLLRVLFFEEEELSDDGICDFIVNGGAKKDDSFLEESRVNIVRAFAVL